MKSRLEQLLRVVGREAEATSAYTGVAAFSAAVMSALASVPRHEFVPEGERLYAYEDRPLPIGQGQTISQPYVVALMTQLLEAGADATVLEVGAGSGYQAAVLARLVRRVHTVEVRAELAESCRARLGRLGVANVSVHEGNGAAGWAAGAPYDGILVAAAARRIPPALVQQLKPAGRLVIPLGAPDAVQELVVAQKKPGGGLELRPVLPVRFVPMVE